MSSPQKKQVSPHTLLTLIPLEHCAQSAGPGLSPYHSSSIL